MDDKTRISALQTLLEKNIEIFIQNGGKLICGGYGDETKNCACALDTIMINDGLEVVDLGYSLRTKVSKKAGVDFYFDELLSVIRGFDHFSFSSELNEDFYNLGIILREKYNPTKME
jgi:hypothetical protein